MNELPYEVEIKMIENNLTVVRGELYAFFFNNRKASGITASKAMLNIKKLSTILRKRIIEDVKARPKQKRYTSPEVIEEAKKKRAYTMKQKKKEVVKKI